MFNVRISEGFFKFFRMSFSNETNVSFVLLTYPSLVTLCALCLPSASFGCRKPGRNLDLSYNFIHPNGSFARLSRQSLTIGSSSSEASPSGGLPSSLKGTSSPLEGTSSPLEATSLPLEETSLSLEATSLPFVLSLAKTSPFEFP